MSYLSNIFKLSTIVVTCSLLLLGTSLLSTVSAADSINKAACDTIEKAGGTGANSSPLCDKSTDDPLTGSGGLIMNVTTVLAWITGILSVIFIVYGGFSFATSSGNPENVSTAKKTVMYSIIGLLVALLSQPIVKYVISLI